MNVLIRSVRIVSPGSPHHGKTKDVLVEDGRITVICDPSKKGTANVAVIEGTDLSLSPGWFDLHVHFGEPGFEHRETLQSGMAAAAHGGYTGVLCMPSTVPPVHSKAEVEFIRKRTDQALVEVVPAGCITVNRDGKEMAELFDMHLSGAKAFTDDQHPIRNAGVLLRALRYCKDFGGQLMVYADDIDLSSKGQMNEGPVSTMLGLKGIPGLAESVMIARDLQILEYTGGRLHFATISTAASVSLIREAKKKGLQVTADVAAYNLLLTDEELNGFDTNFKVKPPLRQETDRSALIEGLKDGTIDAITTDHRPMDVEGKKKEYDLADFGMTGLETGFGMINTSLTNRLSIDRIIELLAIGPRKILGLEVPVITEGAMANLTVFDPGVNWEVSTASLRSRSCNNPMIGRKLIGKPVAVINNGKLYQAE